MEARRRQMSSILNDHPAGGTLLSASQWEATSLGIISLGARREFLTGDLVFLSARFQLFWTTQPPSFPHLPLPFVVLFLPFLSFPFPLIHFPFIMKQWMKN